MRLVRTYAASDHPTSGEIHELQERAVGGFPCGSNNDLAATVVGYDRFTWQVDAAWAPNTLRDIDATIDWRDRVVVVTACQFALDTDKPGGATDFLDWGITATITEVIGYTGTGAYSDHFGAAVSDGNPPVYGAGAPDSYGFRIPVTCYIFADPATGKLQAYSIFGFDLYLTLDIIASADLGKH